MTMAVKIGDQRIVWGGPVNEPVDVPAGVLRWRIRCRPNNVPFIFLRYTNRIEQWIVGRENGRAFPLFFKAANRWKATNAPGL
jgi:hypothetical protein